MKNKLQEKLIAILLVFAMVFLTIPLAKADVIISLDENEKTVNNDESDYMNTNQIQFYQGTNAELKTLYLFSDDDIDDSSVYGLTSYKSQSLTHTLNKNGTSYNCYTHYRVRGFIRDFGSNTTKYNSVCAHEIGHALGWKGHSSNSSDIMYSSYQGVTTLTDRDKYHLKQVYDLF